MIRAFLVIAFSIVMPLLVLSQQSKDTIIAPAKVVVSDSGKIKEKAGVTKVSKDSLLVKAVADSIRKRQFDPRKAALRSAIIPGWGQIYNKKYWKVPIVGAAVGIPAYLVYYNKVWYDRTRYALKVSASGKMIFVSVSASMV